MTGQAQRALYPKHFDLSEVTLTGGPMLTAMEKNFEVLMQYDVDRLLTPYVRQAGLSTLQGTDNPYAGWESLHPNFTNWGGDNFDLSGHVGGHYLSALSLAYAACRDEGMKTRLKERMDYMVSVMKDCQDAFDGNTTGLYGFIGGQPINSAWEQLYQGNTQSIRKVWGWVPFYCQHKILAGLRDAYVYGKSDVAKEVFRKLADWSVNVVNRVGDSDFEDFLNCEHGGMNESMLDAYQLFGDEKYLAAAKKYTHKAMLNGMQTLNTTFLDGKHANTQVPKYIGMERIGEVESANYSRAAENFWTDVAENRTVCIGGNSVSEHFLARSNANRYIDVLDGPESCNSNNMLKLSEMLADRTGDAKYVDFYEQTMWNHILSTQDPTTGGYVYFTSLRPQSYRIYSQVNQAMWCCVGTGMENHSKYGHFIYTHDGAETLYVNLFTPSKLVSEEFAVTQETLFPAINPIASNIPTPNTATTTITVDKAGEYTIAVRHPAWAGKEYQVMVNGQAVEQDVTEGKASYVTLHRTWQEGDKVTVWLPMQLKYEECPGYADYIAFKFGPILLAAQTSVGDPAEAEALDLSCEPSLQNEYGGEGRMDHAPGNRATSKNLTSAPLLIGDRTEVLGRISRIPDASDLRFTIDASREGVDTYHWKTLTLQPFYQIHHARYQCYWYQQTAENYANSPMAMTEAENEALLTRTVDFVAPGEQQSEAGHESVHSDDSSTGDYNTERYRDARANGYVQYTLYNEHRVEDNLCLMLRFNLADRGRKATLTVDGTTIAEITIPSSAKGSDANGFYNMEYPIPDNLLHDAAGVVKGQFVVRLTASSSTLCPGIYALRLMRGYDNHAYVFRASDWTTGDVKRVAASAITYDEENNVIHVQASGANNVCLMLKYGETNYTIAPEQTFLVVRGTNLLTTQGGSYLWWLNGTNHASSVAPTVAIEIQVDNASQQVIAWDMTKSGLYENFSGDRPSVCMGQTIFGLTSTSDYSDIHDISFTGDINKYLAIATAITTPANRLSASSVAPVFDLQGRQVQNKQFRGISVQNGRKYLH
jgi:hypothetical protein